MLCLLIDNEGYETLTYLFETFPNLQNKILEMICVFSSVEFLKKVFRKSKHKLKYL